MLRSPPVRRSPSSLRRPSRSWKSFPRVGLQPGSGSQVQQAGAEAAPGDPAQWLGGYAERERRKAVFLALVLPLILEANAHIAVERKRLLYVSAMIQVGPVVAAETCSPGSAGWPDVTRPNRIAWIFCSNGWMSCRYRWPWPRRPSKAAGVLRDSRRRGMRFSGNGRRPAARAWCRRNARGRHDPQGAGSSTACRSP